MNNPALIRNIKKPVKTITGAKDSIHASSLISDKIIITQTPIRTKMKSVILVRNISFCSFMMSSTNYCLKELL